MKYILLLLSLALIQNCSSMEARKKRKNETQIPNESSDKTSDQAKSPPDQQGKNPPITIPIESYDEIAEDEIVEFYPSYAMFDSKSNQWIINIVGRIFNPTESDTIRLAVEGGFVVATQTTIKDRDYFWSKIKGFAVNHISQKRVKIQIDNMEFPLPESTDAGYISGKLQLSNEVYLRIPQSSKQITFKAKNSSGKEFLGTVHIEDLTGYTVVSDIDDTVKISEVYKGTRAVINNTFNTPAQATPGVKELIEKTLLEKKATLHYLSGGPWQIYTPNSLFFSQKNFPAGSIQMKTIRINPASSEFWDFFSIDNKEGTEELKKKYLEQLLKEFPQKKFILFGDSGERDPEIYAWAVNQFPNQIEQIYIRNVTNESYQNARLTDLFGQNISKVSLLDMNTGSITKN